MSRTTVVMLVLCLVATDPADGQDTTFVRLIGEVRDVTTERRVSNARVTVVELSRARLTDRNGFFAFDSVPTGKWTFEVSAFGYETSVDTSVIAPRNALIVRLNPSPVEVEGLYVSVLERLARRRLAAPSAVIAWDREDLVQAIAPDVGSFVRTRGVARFVSCGGEFSSNDLPNCFIHHGALARLRVFIDDIEQMNAVGTMNLWAYDPRDLWSIEFLPGCRELRIYTVHFMQLVSDGRVRLQPMVCTY